MQEKPKEKKTSPYIAFGLLARLDAKLEDLKQDTVVDIVTDFVRIRLARVVYGVAEDDKAIFIWYHGLKKHIVVDLDNVTSIYILTPLEVFSACEEIISEMKGEIIRAVGAATNSILEKITTPELELNHKA